MARNQGPAKAAPRKQPAGTAVGNWDEEMAKMATASAAVEASSGGGSFVSIKGGVLSYQDAAMPGNQMAVVVLDSIHENVHYPGKYDASNPSGPDCFAFGRSEADLAPHQAVLDAGTQQADHCGACPLNEWGSAETGRGKGCRNTRRLALVGYGSFDAQGRFLAPEDPVAAVADQEIGFFKLPVTSVKGWAGYVKQLEAAHRRPPLGMVTRVRVVPDQKTMFRVVFEAVERLPNDVMQAVMARHQEAKATIEFPYSVAAEPAPAPAPKRAPARQAARPARKF